MSSVQFPNWRDKYRVIAGKTCNEQNPTHDFPCRTPPQGDWNATVGPNWQEQWDALQWQKPLKVRYPEEQRGIRPMASHTTRLTIFSHHGDSSTASTEPRAEHLQFRKRISTATTTWLWWQWSWSWRKTWAVTAQDTSSIFKRWKTRMKQTYSKRWLEANLQHLCNLLAENIDNLTENLQRSLIDLLCLTKPERGNRGWPVTFWICVTGKETSRKEEMMALAMHNSSEVKQGIRRRNKKEAKDTSDTWFTDRCQEIDSAMRTGNSETAFITLKLLTWRQETKTNFIENTKGKHLRELREAKAMHEQRRTEYWTEWVTCRSVCTLFSAWSFKMWSAETNARKAHKLWDYGHRCAGQNVRFLAGKR